MAKVENLIIQSLYISSFTHFQECCFMYSQTQILQAAAAFNVPQIKACLWKLQCPQNAEHMQFQRIIIFFSLLIQ